MMVVGLLDLVLQALRTAFFAVAVATGVLALLDWLVRTRRINPFSGLARAVRGVSDPLMKPVERRIVRAGGLPSSAPWWTLVFVVLGGIVVLSLLGFVRDQIATAFYLASAGPAGLYRLLVTWTFTILQVALLVRVVMSWVGGSPYSSWGRLVYGLTEWLLRPIRTFLPSMAGIDFSPMLAYFLLSFLQGAFLRLM